MYLFIYCIFTSGFSRLAPTVKYIAMPYNRNCVCCRKVLSYKKEPNCQGLFKTFNTTIFCLFRCCMRVVLHDAFTQCG